MAKYFKYNLTFFVSVGQLDRLRFGDDHEERGMATSSHFTMLPSCLLDPLFRHEYQVQVGKCVSLVEGLYPGEDFAITPQLSLAAAMMTDAERVDIMRSCGLIAGAKKNVRRNANNAKSNQLRTVVRKEVKREEMRNSVLKFIDTFLNSANVGSGGTLTSLATIPQGAAQSNRVGDHIIADHLRLHMNIIQSNTDVYTSVRSIVFQWYPNTALTAPAVASILQNSTGNGLWTDFNFQYRQQYTVLYDMTHSGAGLAAAPTASTNFSFRRPVKIRIPLRTNGIEFTPGATSQTNSIWLLQISDSAVTPFPIVSWNARLFYRDDD